MTVNSRLRLKRRGEPELGTFNALDGEMIVLDGQVWQVQASGKPAFRRVPFAVVVRFAPRLANPGAGARSDGVRSGRRGGHAVGFCFPANFSGVNVPG